jgi:hypothetical protein
MIAYRCYDPSDAGDGGIHRWYHTQPSEFRGEIDGALELLALEKNLEAAPQVSALRGACAGLHEIKIDFLSSKKIVHIRILGFRDARGRFVLLSGFQKTSNANYAPHCRSARFQIRGIEKDERRAHPCQFP